MDDFYDVKTPQEGVFITNNQSVTNEYHIYFDEDVREPSYYRGALEVLGAATAADYVVLHINTMGGSLSSAVSLYSAIKASEAAVVGVIEFESSSAGSVLAMACCELVVNPYSVMMVHNARGGTVADYTNTMAQIEAFQKSVKGLYEEAFKHFLSPEEIKEVFSTGKDFYFDAEEIETRWQHKVMKELEEKE